MRRVLKWLGIGLAVLLALPLAVIAGVLVLLNVEPGQRLVERELPALTGGAVVVSGLSGGIPWAPRVAHIEIRDDQGTWLAIDRLALDWHPLRLLGDDADITALTAALVDVRRLPHSSAGPSKANQGKSSFSLPVRVDLDRLHVARLAIGAAVAGRPAAVSLDGAAHLVSLEDGSVKLAVARLDGPGSYDLDGRIDPARIAAKLAAQEPAGGLVSGLAGLPDLGALSLQADVDGPWSGAALKLGLAAGQLHADVTGRIDVTGRSADLDIAARAPAMAPRPGIAWQSVSLDAHVHGPLTRPAASGMLRIAGLAAAGAGAGLIAADLSGDAGQVALQARIEGLRLPGPQPEVFAAAPLLLTARATLDRPDRPVAFTVQHPLLSLDGTATTAPGIAGQVTLKVPDLGPLARLGGVDLAGSLGLTAKAASQGTAAHVDLAGTVDVTGGMAPAVGLLGHATLAVAAAKDGADYTLSHLAVDGRALHLAASGRYAGDRVALDWTLGLSDLHALAATLAGGFTGHGHLAGPTDDLTASAEFAGQVAAQGVPKGPLTVTLQASGLPGRPSATLAAAGELDRARLALDVAVRRDAAGALHVAIDKADWKSVHGEGALTLAQGARLPQGTVELRVARLADFAPLVGLPLTGALGLDADLADQRLLRLKATASDAGLAGRATVARLSLDASVADPLAAARVQARLVADGIAAGAIGGSLRFEGSGPERDLALRLAASLTGVAGADATLSAAAALDLPDKRVSLSTLQAGWKEASLRLLAPARIGFGDPVAVDRLRLGLASGGQQAVIDLAGRLSPTLDLTASVTGVTPDLARPFVPSLDAAGTIAATARLAGTPARPTGQVSLQASGLHMRSGPGRSLPPANLTAEAVLQGSSARLDVRADAGRATELRIAGTAPLTRGGALDLAATGAVDLTLFDPIFSAQGRRIAGRLALDARAGGTLAAPRLSGQVTLAGGEVQDFTQGVHLAAIEARLVASGETVRIERFSAKAGQGTLTASGSVGALAPGLPVDLRITARNAQLLSSDIVNAVADADLTVAGSEATRLALAGRIKLLRTAIQVPDKLPSSVAVLPVRLAGQKPPPPPAPPPVIGLDLDLSAVRIFVRGRGIDAELGGRLHVSGTTARPLPSGGFTLHRGTFSLAGTTLTFSEGQVTFNGASRIDPTLHFVASSSSQSVVATLTVGGYASHPTITLSSSPELPQDEVLAHLLFGQSVASLSPFQLAEIAAALAQIAGVGGGVDPLNSIRQSLGLDRLSVGSSNSTLPGQSPTTTSSTAAPSIEAGKYVAPGVYVGAKQGTTGAETQATVQIDLFKGLKLETDAGSGQGANAVGLLYQFQY